jgi:hypothetical protein
VGRRGVADVIVERRRRSIVQNDDDEDDAVVAVVCPADVFECPDGHFFLERNPEDDCEFGDCPPDDDTATSAMSNGTGTTGTAAGGGDDFVVVIDDPDMYRNESDAGASSSSSSASSSSSTSEAQGGQEGMATSGGMTEEEDAPRAPSSSSSSTSAAGAGGGGGGGVDDPIRRAWIAHGAMGLLAFGLLAPAAISSAVFRDACAPSHWIYLHVVSNCLVLALAFACVTLAVSNMRGMGVGWEGHMKETHHLAGLALLATSSFQVANGFLRPPREYDLGDALAFDRRSSGGGGAPTTATTTTFRSRAEEFAFGLLTPRKLWRLAHAISGLFLFGLGTYQVRSGMGLYADRYPGEAPDYGPAYVGYVLWLVGVIACAKVWLVWNRRRSMPNFSE